MSSSALKLKYMREKSGLKRNGLAEIVGVHPSTIGNLEKGSIPQADLLYKLSSFFGVTMEYIMNPNISEIAFSQFQINKFNTNQEHYLELFARLDDMDQLEIIKIIELKLSIKGDFATKTTSSPSTDKILA